MLADELLKRPGGDKVKAENRSPRRQALLRQLAACVYHKVRMEPGPLWQEIDRTAQAFWGALLGQEDATILYALGREAPKQLKEGRWYPLTLHSWARHLYFFLDYLSDDRVGVLPKEIYVYEANHESLRPLLAEANGLNNDAKRFTFLLGILYGHLIYVQSRKAEVNVSANALSWMRGGRLRAAELHDLYGKVAYKLQEYDALGVGRYRKWKLIHELEAEMSHLGKRVHIPIRPEDLPDEQVLYFLMLGIALSYDVTNPESPKAEGDAR
jgi:CRISPR-associated protein Csh1